jgi:hypothetical protein
MNGDPNNANGNPKVIAYNKYIELRDLNEEAVRICDEKCHNLRLLEEGIKGMGQGFFETHNMTIIDAYAAVILAHDYVRLTSGEQHAAWLVWFNM